MWAAFLHLIWRATQNTISEKGTTLLAWGIGLFTSVTPFIVQMWGQRKQGRAAVLAKLRNWKPYIGLALSFVVWTCIFIYTAAKIVYDDHVYLRTTVAALSQPQREGPDFHPSITNVGVFPAGDKANSAVLVVGTIYNQGSPGNLNDIYIEAVFADGRRVPVHLANSSSKGMAYFGKNNQGQTMGMPIAQYWFNERTILIPKFGRLDGFAAGLLPGVNLNEIKEKHRMFVLTCTDVTERRTSTEYKWGSGPSAFDDLGLSDLQRPLHKNGATSGSTQR